MRNSPIIYAMAGVVLLVLGIVLTASARGIEPGFGLSQPACEFLVGSAGFFMVLYGTVIFMIALAEIDSDRQHYSRRRYNRHSR